ncbi:MAG: DNA internalization-related competence protein ComEC/Rec2 [Phycisphaerae bacterium]|nr:DNA internalization-related competence protein ComEC/Rec2 [Phycisphaerae bacterium]
MDSVKRQLEALDSQLTPPDHLALCSRRIPLLLPVLSLILGVLMQSFLQGSRVGWLGLLLASPLALLYRGPHRFMGLACVTVLALGGLRLACFTSLPTRDISHAVPTNQDIPATLTGRISTVPKLVETEWEYGSQQPMAPGQSFDLKLEDHYSGTIRVYVTEPMPDLTIGTRIRLHGRVSRVTPALNPGQFDLATHLARRNCFVTAFVKSPVSIEILPDTAPPGYRILRARGRMQQRLAESLIPPHGETSARSALLQALILGLRDDVPSVTLQAFQTTGLLHLISLSGLHVGIFMSMVWAMGQCAGLLKPARSLLCLGVLAGFLWLVPWRAATVRASLIAGLFCTAVFFRRKPQPLNTLSLAALVLLLIRPTQLFEAGWQLSFSSVLGILLISSSVNAWFRQRFQSLWSGFKTLPWRIVHYIVRSALTLLAVGLGAWLGSAAILAYHFYGLTPLSVLYTLIALPLVALILMVGLVHIITVLICPCLNPITLAILNSLSTGLMTTVHGLGLIKGSHILLGHISWAPVTLYYGLLLSGLLWRKRSIRPALIGLAVILPLVWIQGLKVWRDRTPSLTLTCLNVGHGQALVLHTSENHTFIFDAGSLYQKDIGRRIVSAYLDYCGISHVNAIVASHNDADHINGIPEIILHCHVGHVYAPALMLNQASRGEGPAPWLERFLQRHERTLEPWPATLSVEEGLSMRQLWPDPNTAESPLSDNNASLVLLITFGTQSILVTSDIESPTQQRLMSRYPTLHPDILLAPHHGSLTTLSETFLTNLEPNIILCSCGTSQFRRHRVINTPTTYHTPKQGAITLLINEKGETCVKFVHGK